MAVLTDEELALRIISTEDAYVERKTAGDYKRWIPALVAFANSAPIGFDCVLFVGAKDDGTLEPNLGVESLQKSFSEKAAEYIRRYHILQKFLEREVVNASPLSFKAAQTDLITLGCHT